MSYTHPVVTSKNFTPAKLRPGCNLAASNNNPITSSVLATSPLIRPHLTSASGNGKKSYSERLGLGIFAAMAVAVPLSMGVTGKN